MNSLHPAGPSFPDDHRSSFNLNNSGFTAKDIELGTSAYLSTPKIRRFPSPALSELSIYGRTIYTELDPPKPELLPVDDGHFQNIKERLHSFWERNWGLAFVFFAQFFGNLMAVSARLLEQDSPDRPGMHTFQVNQYSPIMLQRA